MHGLRGVVVVFGFVVLGVGGVGVVASCAKQPASARAGKSVEALRDLSSSPVGRGFDRALDQERDSCFARTPVTVTSQSKWSGTGFPVFTEKELPVKINTAIEVGVKVDDVEGVFGAATAGRVGSSGEQSHLVMLARYVARTEKAGTARGPGPACAQVPSNSQNGLEDFVTTCGDRYLDEKVFGGHVLISWLRSQGRGPVDDMMATMFGAATVGATFDPLTNLSTLKTQGLGDEEVFIEALGMPFGPTQVQLPNGQTGYSVTSAAEYLESLLQANVGSFARVVDYTLTRYPVSDIDACLASTGRQSTMDETEWACVYDHLSGLADTRDGEGDLAELQNAYELHRLALDEYLPNNRLVFNTVPQSMCQVDLDGDQAFEKSGPCQAQLLKNFLTFFEACTVKSSEVLSTCRADVLGIVDTCAAFEAKDCKLPQMTLSNGAVVTCGEAGVNAALADLVNYQVLPPFSNAPPPIGFAPPLVLQFTTDMGVFPIPGVSPDVDLCGITGIRGGLHESAVAIESWAGQQPSTYMLTLESASQDFDKRVSVEVTCVKLTNFFYLNGGSATVEDTEYLHIPILNAGTLHREALTQPGNPMLAGWFRYLDEPATVVQVTNPSASGMAFYEGTDNFPLISTNPWPTSFSVNANPPPSGGDPGGTLLDRQSGQASQKRAFIDVTSRSAQFMSSPLTTNAFCYLTGLSGRYFNVSDSARITTSDGFVNLVISTPFAKDRNPGARAQCVQFDQP